MRTQRLARTWLGTPPSPSEEISIPGYDQAVEAAMSLDPITGNVTLVAQTRDMGTDAEIPPELLPANSLVAGRARSPVRERQSLSEAESFALGSLFRERPPHGDPAIPLRVRVELLTAPRTTDRLLHQRDLPIARLCTRS